MNYLTDAQIRGMADAVLTSHEVTPLSHARKCEVALEYAQDFFGCTPRRSAILLAVKLANLGWHAATIDAKRAS